MKLTKTQWILVALVAALAIWYFFLRNKDEGTKKESGYNAFDYSKSKRRFERCYFNCDDAFTSKNKYCDTLKIASEIAKCKTQAKVEYVKCRDNCRNIYMSETGQL